MNRIRRIARPALMASILFVILGWAMAVPAAPTARAWDAGTFSPADESLLFSLTNQARAAAGLAPLRNDGQLHSLAEWRAQDMSVRNYFSHQIPPDGYYVFHYMDQRGIQYVLAGENIGWDNAPDDQATAMVQDMFMNSPEHRANILGVKWDSMGIGAYKGTDGVIKYTVLFKESVAAPVATPNPTPRPTPNSTPVPTQAPAPKPTSTHQPASTPWPTDTPAAATPAPTATPVPTTSPTATPAPTDTPAPTVTPVSATAPASTPSLTPFVSPVVPASAEAPGAGVPGQTGTSQRIVDDAPSPGLIQSLVSAVLGLLGSI